MSRARGPHRPKQTRDEVTSRISTEPSSGRFDRSQPASWLPYAVPVTSMNRSSARRVTVRSAWMPPRRSSSCVYTIDPTGPVDVVARDPLQERAGARPATSSLANDVSSNSAAAGRVASASAAIAGDQWRPAQPRGRSASSASRPPNRGSSAFGSNQFGRSQPDFSPNTAPSRGEIVIGRRRAQRSARLPLLVRVVDVVVGRVVLDRPRQRVGLRPVRRPEPADVHLPEVELGLAVDDPARHLPPDAACAGDPVRAEPGRDPEPADIGLAEDELVVRRERLRPVDHPADAAPPPSRARGGWRPP